jgi:hypothetical protein
MKDSIGQLRRALEVAKEQREADMQANQLQRSQEASLMQGTIRALRHKLEGHTDAKS